LAGAVALIVIGLLILIPSGLCTGSVVITPLVSAIQHPSFAAGMFGTLPLALLFGGPFIWFGGTLIWMGITRLRARREGED
jgi:protein-S-isoprenylcysteine O-methyltransferase Ste14